MAVAGVVGAAHPDPARPVGRHADRAGAAPRQGVLRGRRPHRPGGASSSSRIDGLGSLAPFMYSMILWGAVDDHTEAFVTSLLMVLVRAALVGAGLEPSGDEDQGAGLARWARPVPPPTRQPRRVRRHPGRRRRRASPGQRHRVRAADDPGAHRPGHARASTGPASGCGVGRSPTTGPSGCVDAAHARRSASGVGHPGRARALQRRRLALVVPPRRPPAPAAVVGRRRRRPCRPTAAARVFDRPRCGRTRPSPGPADRPASPTPPGCGRSSGVVRGRAATLERASRRRPLTLPTRRCRHRRPAADPGRPRPPWWPRCCRRLAGRQGEAVSVGDERSQHARSATAVAADARRSGRLLARRPTRSSPGAGSCRWATAKVEAVVLAQAPRADLASVAGLDVERVEAFPVIPVARSATSRARGSATPPTSPPSSSPPPPPPSARWRLAPRCPSPRSARSSRCSGAGTSTSAGWKSGRR